MKNFRRKLLTYGSIFALFCCGCCLRHCFARTPPRFEIPSGNLTGFIFASNATDAAKTACSSGSVLQLVKNLHLLPIIKEREGATATIYMDSQKKYVLKVLTGYLRFAPHVREACVLLKISQFAWAPKLLCVGPNYMLMTYMGKTACEDSSRFRKNLSLARQLNQIVSDLRSVGVKHNDLAKENLKHVLMEKTGMVSLVDYGWATVNGRLDVNCTLNGKPIFAPNARPYNEEMNRGAAMHETAASVIPHLKKCDDGTFSKYFDKSRKTKGSQSETPVLSVLRDGALSVTGYHFFTVSLEGAVTVLQKKEKYDVITGLLRALYDEDRRTLVDIGSNTGVVSFLAAEIGYEQVTALDHDEPAVEIINTISKEVSSVVRASQFSFGDPPLTKADVVYMGSLIHWVWCLTADFNGNFINILRYVTRFAKKNIIIEFVEPEDSAIQHFGHTSKKCKNISSEKYTTRAFEQALENLQVSVKDKFVAEPHRILYVLEVLPRSSNSMIFH